MRVVVLKGGRSLERAVSLQSGARVEEAVTALGHDVVAIDADERLVSRLKEEVHAGMRTGLIRTMGGSGSVVTIAGLVFAFTMMTMVVSDLTVMGQVGTTIGLGLLFDTFIVRSLITPSIAALLGRWFWWPINVHRRPAAIPAAHPAEREVGRTLQDEREGTFTLAPESPALEPTAPVPAG